MAFAADSSGTGPAPVPVTPPAPAPTPPAPDVTPPIITSATGPKKISVKKRAKFSFAANEVGSFRCKVGSREFQPCTSPYTAPKLGAGHYVFYVQVVDATGNPSALKQVGFSVKKPPKPKKR